MVQPKSAILVLFYDQAQRIYSLTPATGAIPMHQASWESRSMQTVQIADVEKGARQWPAFVLASGSPIARSRAKPPNSCGNMKLRCCSIHSVRVFVFGAMKGVRQNLKFDSELLYVAALFHDLGLVDAYQGS
jgi:HD domain-containing protein